MYYHVKVGALDPKGDAVFQFNLTYDQIIERLVSPFEEGRAFRFAGMTIDPRRMGRLSIMETEFSVNEDDRYLLETMWGVISLGRDVTDELIKAPAGSRTALDLVVEYTKATGKQPDNRVVMVVYGRDIKIRKSMFDFIRALGLDPKEWSSAVRLSGEGSPYIGQVLDKLFNTAQAVLVLMTPDDVAYLDERLWQKNETEEEKTPSGQPRPNVLFEAGMAFGKMPERTILVTVGKLRSITDIQGRHVVHLDNSEGRRLELAQRLETAGCPIDWSRGDWLTTGDFKIYRTSRKPKPGVAKGAGEVKPTSKQETTSTEIKNKRVGSVSRQVEQQLASLEREAGTLTHWLVGYTSREPETVYEMEQRLEYVQQAAGALRRYKELSRKIDDFTNRAGIMFVESQSALTSEDRQTAAKELDNTFDVLCQAIDQVRELGG